MRIAFILLFTLFNCLCFGQKEVYRGLAASWVEPIEVEVDTIMEDNGGSQYLLIDYQFNLIEKTYFNHWAIKILNSTGIQDHSDIEVNFDPTYQKLTFHSVQIIRNGRTISKLKTAHIEVVQLEESKEYLIYDGSLTALIHLEDVRDGDIIEYSYSIKGLNPINKGNISGTLTQEYAVVVNRIFQRLITEDKDQLKFQFNNGASDPEQIEINNEVIYEWDLKSLDRIIYDKNVPNWYNAQRSVQYTTYNTWNEVANWATELYQLSQNEGSTIQHTFNADESLEEQVMSAIRFVQDDIRYLGLENGISAYKPHAPTAVYKQKYGDCKDKSLLLVSLLNKLKVEAYPFLVNTDLKQEVTNRLPAHNIFDHCVVNLVFEGENYFIDPTISSQRGNIYSISFPDYKYGLRVRATEEGLTKIPEGEKASINIIEEFRLNAIGDSAQLKIVTEYTGLKADNVRNRFANSSNEKIQKNYLDFYSSLFPDIESVGEVIFIDENHKSTNKVKIIEEYSIQNLWNKEDSSLIFFEIYPIVLGDILTHTKSAKRSMPYYLGPTNTFHQTTKVYFPENWPVEPEKKKIENDVFSYRSNLSGKGKNMTISYDYEIKKEYLSGEETAEFLEENEKVRNDLSFYVSYNFFSSTFKLSWYSLMIAMISLVIGVFFARKIHRNYDPKPVENATKMDIGGWLILPAIGLILTPILIVVEIAPLDYFNQNIWDTIFSYSTKTSLMWGGLLSIELIYNSMFFVFTVLVLIHFFKKRSSTPKLMIIFYITSLVFLLIDTLLAGQIVELQLGNESWVDQYTDVMRGAIAALIWVPYFMTSTRVKNTFWVRRRNNIVEHIEPEINFRHDT